MASLRRVQHGTASNINILLRYNQVSMPIEDLWNQIVRAKNASDYVFKEISVPKLTPSEASKCRKLCEQNVCKCYGTNWACPPGVGNLGDCMTQIRMYKHAAVIYHRSEVNMKDQDGLKRLSGILQNLLRDFRNLLKENGYPTMCLADGGCNYCGACAYPKECKFPDQRVGSISAYGIMLMEYLEDNSIEFRFEDGYATFYGLVFYNEKDEIAVA